MVAWNFTPDLPATSLVGGVAKSVFGYEAALPDTYGLKPRELAELLESLR
jgi:hypothetical protein